MIWKTSAKVLQKISIPVINKVFLGTERDGNSNTNDQPNEWGYSPRAFDKSLIDNPPRTQPGGEKK